MAEDGVKLPHLRVLVGAHESGITACMPIRDKTTEELVSATQKLILNIEQHYKPPLISRIHSDEEGGLQQDPKLGKLMANRAIRLTVCPGFGSARAESAIGRLAGRARSQLLNRNYDPAVIPLIWPYLMCNVAHQEANIKLKKLNLNAPSLTRPTLQTGQQVLVPTGSKDRHSPRFIEAMYLSQAPEQTMGHNALPLYQGRGNHPVIKNVIRIDQVKPMVNGQGEIIYRDDIKIQIGVNRFLPLKQIDKIEEGVQIYNDCPRCKPAPTGVCVRHRNQVLNAQFSEYQEQRKHQKLMAFMASIDLERRIPTPKSCPNLSRDGLLWMAYHTYLLKLDEDAGTTQELYDEINVYELDSDDYLQNYVTELYMGPKNDQTVAAMGDEVKKMREFGVFDMTAVDIRDLRKRNDKDSSSIRVVGVKGIMSIKNIEEDATKHEYKGRIVATGNFVRDIWPNKVTDWSVWPPTASMSAMRFVCGQAAIHRQNLEGIDLRSAYLQAPLEEEEGEWYAILDENAASGLTEEERRLRREIEASGGTPVHRLRTSLYGRTKSGSTWVKNFLNFLKRNNFKPSGFDAALWYRKEPGNQVTWVAVYVDDMLATAPQHLLDKFWQEVRECYSVKESSAGIAKKFIGVEFRRNTTNTNRDEVRLSLRDYTKRICKRYIKALSGTIRPKNSPATINLYEDLHEVKSKDN